MRRRRRPAYSTTCQPTEQSDAQHTSNDNLSSQVTFVDTPASETPMPGIYSGCEINKGRTKQIKPGSDVEDKDNDENKMVTTALYASEAEPLTE